MAIRHIDNSDFDAHVPAREPMLKMLATEKSWFASDNGNVIGAILLDHTDKDWNYVILGPHDDGKFRWIDGNSSYRTHDDAEDAIIAAMGAYEKEGKRTEDIFQSATAEEPDEETRIVFGDINEELKNYFAKHPEKLYDLSPRKFEELIASIFSDFGFDVELTKATRDGGRDILAYFRNAVCQYLTYVECKKYAPDNKVGVDIVRHVSGVHYLHRPAKSLIVTTSFFTKDAIAEARTIEHQLELKDYDQIKAWLARYV